MRPTFKVVCEIEVRASTPEAAATIARDIMLDPDGKLSVDVLLMEYVRDADDWFPVEDRGWWFQFNSPVRGRGTVTSPVEPTDCIPWAKQCPGV